LQEQGVHIWDGNSTKEFMESRGLGHYPEGQLGKIYGFQWRHFNAESDLKTGKAVYDKEGNRGIDQLQQIIDALKDPKQRTSRRLIMTAWNPCQLDEMALPPCHVMCQFNVHDGNKLSCALYLRGNDTTLGLPFNVASYSFLTHLLAKHCGLEAYEFIYFCGNAHIYEDHIEPIKAIFDRVPYEFPTLEITNKKNDINDYEVSDFFVSDYKCHEVIKMKMVA
jgi:thymidylate synthase